MPKAVEINTQAIDQFIDSLKIRRQELKDEIRSTRDGSGSNPLSATANQDQKQVARNTGTTNDKLDELIRETRAGRNSGPQLVPAGVR